MSLRTLLYSQFTAIGTPLYNLIEGRAYPKKSMRSSVEPHPYIVFKLGNETNEGLAETERVNRQYFQVYVHDDNSIAQGGDYLQIDQIVQALKDLLHLLSSPADGVIQVMFLETSQDLDDQTLGTLMKYVRFQALIREASDG